MGSQRFDLTVRGHHHAVTSGDVGLRREVVWLVDGAEVARRRTTDDRFHLDADGVGRVEVRAGMLGVRRATLHVGDEVIDLTPEAGSSAARREDRIRRRPRVYAVVQTLVAVAKVVVPLLGIGMVLSWLPDWNLPRLPLPRIDLPDLNLPDLPWPHLDLPTIPWPDWTVPPWLKQLLEATKFVGPVLLATALAVREIRRRRQQDARRAQAAQQAAQQAAEQAAEPEAQQHAAQTAAHPKRARRDLEDRLAADLRAHLSDREQETPRSRA